MPTFNRKRLAEILSGIGNALGAVFLVGFTVFAGFCFVFGMAFTLVLIVLSVWFVAVNGRFIGGLPVVIFPPFMGVYLYVSWRLFWFGLSILRGDRPAEAIAHRG